MYQALAGLGTYRLVMLPNESHIYRAGVDSAYAVGARSMDESLCQECQTCSGAIRIASEILSKVLQMR